MVETSRLHIIPLNYGELRKYLEANNHLEMLMGLTSTNRLISPGIKEMVETFTLPHVKRSHGKDYLFYTFWLVIDRSMNTIVAELGFKGTPGKDGDIEIGYGTMPGFEKRGYMTEAVSGMLDWAASRPDVRIMLAETDDDNLASIRIVQKNDFTFWERRGKMLWWKKFVGQNSNVTPV